MDEAAARVIAAERRLLLPEVRRDQAAVEQLLAPDFCEIGQSGRLWTRAELMEALANEDPAALARYEMSDERVMQVSENVSLLTYRLVAPSGLTRRSSLWRSTGGLCRLLFHQGTVIR